MIKRYNFAPSPQNFHSLLYGYILVQFSYLKMIMDYNILQIRREMYLNKPSVRERK